MKLSSESSQLIFDAALKKGIKVKVVSKRFNLIKFFLKDKNFFTKTTSFPVNSQTACMIANNKFLTKKVLKENNILMPKSWLVRTPAEARRLVLKKQPYPCVLKPARGAHGHNVYVNINSFDEFNELLPFVFGKFKQRSVLIEEYVEGKDYRFLVVGDKVSAVMERIPAHVIGDGKSSIEELIDQFNHNPMVGIKYEKPLCKIEINGEIKEIPKDSILKIVYRDLSKLEEEKIRTEEETKSNNEKPQLKKGDDEKRNREEVSKQKMN